jgi:hypothetical protein
MKKNVHEITIKIEGKEWETILDKAFKKKKFKRSDDFLVVLDTISRKYSTYNKLVFLSQKLNDNYVEYKKNVLRHSFYL